MFIVNIPAIGRRLIVEGRADARAWALFYASMGMACAVTPA